MDGLVISLVVKHLSGRDLVMFAQVNTIAYTYCKNTNILHRPCPVTHTCYRATPTLLEEAKLTCCLNFLNDVRALASSKVSLSDYCTDITLHKHCGTKITLCVGRVLIINKLIYTYNNFDVLCELQNVKMKHCTQILNIDANMIRLRHKLNSLITHLYTDVTVKTSNTTSNIETMDPLALLGIRSLVKMLTLNVNPKHQLKSTQSK